MSSGNNLVTSILHCCNCCGSIWNICFLLFYALEIYGISRCNGCLHRTQNLVSCNSSSFDKPIRTWLLSFSVVTTSNHLSLMINILSIFSFGTFLMHIATWNVIFVVLFLVASSFVCSIFFLSWHFKKTFCRTWNILCCCVYFCRIILCIRSYIF